MPSQCESFHENRQFSIKGFTASTFLASTYFILYRKQVEACEVNHPKFDLQSRFHDDQKSQRFSNFRRTSQTPRSYLKLFRSSKRTVEDDAYDSSSFLLLRGRAAQKQKSRNREAKTSWHQERSRAEFIALSDQRRSHDPSMNNSHGREEIDKCL